MSTEECTTTSGEIYLLAGEVWSGKAIPGLQIVCKRGIVWLTQFNDPQDYFLHPGQRFLVTRHGRVVVQALIAATISRHNTRSQQTMVSVLGKAWQHLV